MRYIIVGNSPYKTFHKLYQPNQNDYYIGLDEGSIEIINKGYVLNEAWGDFDYVDDLNKIKKYTSKFNLFPKEKNETDLELILSNLSKLNVEEDIYIYDITGGRLDHEFINILLIQKFNNLNIKIIDEYNEISYIDKKGEYEIKSDGYSYIGLITYTSATISIEEAKYKLDKTYITNKDTFTTSNQFYNDIFKFTLYDGNVILIKSK